MEHLLKTLMEALGPSGSEVPVRTIIMKEIKPYVDELSVDKFGNLIAHKKGTGKGEKVVFVAHMDEIALMVKSVEDNGQMRISTVGGISPVTLVGQLVAVLDRNGKQACEGVVSFPELHEDLEINMLPKLEDLYVDSGLDRRALKRHGVEVGSYIIPSHHFRFLDSQKIFCGKAIDNRSGCYIVIELIKKLKHIKHDLDLYFLFSVQEEIGMYGAQVSLYNINPDWGIAVDTTNSQDSECISPPPDAITIGNGPVLILKDAEIITNKCLDDYLIKLAKKHKIPLQTKVEEVGTTDATRIMLYKKGLPSTVVGICLRNIHSSVGIASIDDVNNTVQLLFALIKNPPKIGV